MKGKTRVIEFFIIAWVVLLSVIFLAWALLYSLWHLEPPGKVVAQWIGEVLE